MRTVIRRILDRLFTSIAGLSVLLMAAALVLVLGPIIVRGASAVFFSGTVEFRRMQMQEFDCGDAEAVKAEVQQCQQARQNVWGLIGHFSLGIDTDRLESQVKDALREYDKQMRNRVEAGSLGSQEARDLRDKARRLRDLLIEATATADKAEALGKLQEVLDSPDCVALAGTAGEELARLAGQYKVTVESVDLTRRGEYAAKLSEVRQLLTRLLGPAPGSDPAADLAQFRYGATRWDQALKLRDELTWTDKYVADQPGTPLKVVRVSRAEEFAGTELAGLFTMIDQRLDDMLHPRRTFYWRFLTDDSTPGHFFGGVGPEALGTLMLTALAMLLAVPVGVMTAAYLVECMRESHALRVLRTCINTLAGVPSIVFGLFGLAFFVLWLLPKFNLSGGPSVLAGSLTLGVLVLPIIIRASEEAIRAVPPSYREASLALGAGGLRTFVKVTLPAAMPGILTGVILSISRAAGETAPILFTAAVAVGPWPGSLFKPCRALSYASYDMAVSDKLASQVPHNQFGMVLTLVMLVLLLNVVAIVIRSRLARKLRGG
jgi:phosphate transport system permease protein